MPGRKEEGITRLLYKNANGIQNRLAGNDKLEKAKDLINELGADVVAYNKHRQNLRHRDNRNGWNQLFKGGEADLVGNSVLGFRFLGLPEFGIPLPSSEFRNFPAEKQIGKPENRSSRKSEFRYRFFRNSGIPLITYIGTKYFLIL